MSNQIIHNKKKLTVEVEIVIVKEDDYFVAYCPTLELSAYGDSEEYAIKSFREEVDIFLEEAQKQGTLEKYLLKNGWRLVQVPQPIYEPPHLNTTELFDVFKSGKSVIRQDLKFSV
jgi:predicted RNase H-like HicB family nuclease